ncbi:hypothetical protein N9L47_13750 [Rhodobacteraceae bacterium]|nr:hypothetical protein [Paracoccaceae bacterium]
MNNRFFRIALRVLLVVSLLINVAVLGYVLQLRSLAKDIGLDGIRLPREVRQEFLQLAKQDDGILEKTRKLGDARRRLNDATMADPYDAALVEDLARAADVANSELRALTQSVLVQATANVAKQDGRLP